MPKWIGRVFGNPIATTDNIIGQKGIFDISDRLYFANRINATGGTITTPGDGYIYHTFTAPGTFSIQTGTGPVEMVAIGGGGGGGGYDPPAPGAGGGAGGIAAANFTLNPGSYTVSIGGGGGGGGSEVTGSGGGTAGSNGGGSGGNAGPIPFSAGGGGGGGWSGVYDPSIYYVVGGGGAGGGGANEGPANDSAALGGGSGTFSLTTMNGSNGNPYPGDGGGYGGAGGGFDGSIGGGGLGGTTPISGGSNYGNPTLLLTPTDSFTLYTGPNGQASGPAGGTRNPSFAPNPLSSAVPATAGYGGSGDTDLGGSGNPGVDGIVVFRYSLDTLLDYKKSLIKATGGTPYVPGDGYEYLVFTSTDTLTVNSPVSVDYLVVAGGGGGGVDWFNARSSGGGGAGGFRTGTGIPLTTPLTITVGGGGAGGLVSPNPATRGTNGSPSIFSTITSAGGGGGAAHDNVGNIAANPGGSGGGSTHDNTNGPRGLGNQPPVSPPQGSDGGTAGNTIGGDGSIVPGWNIPSSYGTLGPTPGRYFAGGGGASSSPAIPDFAGGGGGGASQTGQPGSTRVGGAGGGGTGGTSSGTTPSAGSAGNTNTGGGGGGSRWTTGGAGGSGIVIIRYLI